MQSTTIPLQNAELLHVWGKLEILGKIVTKEVVVVGFLKEKTTGKIHGSAMWFMI